MKEGGRASGRTRKECQNEPVGRVTACRQAYPEVTARHQLKRSVPLRGQVELLDDESDEGRVERADDGFFHGHFKVGQLENCDVAEGGRVLAVRIVDRVDDWDRVRKVAALNARSVGF